MRRLTAPRAATRAAHRARVPNARPVGLPARMPQRGGAGRTFACQREPSPIEQPVEPNGSRCDETVAGGVGSIDKAPNQRRSGLRLEIDHRSRWVAGQTSTPSVGAIGILDCAHGEEVPARPYAYLPVERAVR